MSESTPALPHTAEGTTTTGPSRHSLGVPLLRVLGLAATALFAGVALVKCLSQSVELQLTGYLKAEQTVVYAPRSGRVLRHFAKSGDVVKPREQLMQLTDDTLDREIAAASLEARSLEAALEQCRARAEVQISQECETLDDKLHRTRLEAANYLRDHYSANFRFTMLREYAGLSVSPDKSWVLGPGMINDPQRLFGAVAPEPVIAPEDAKMQAIMRRENARNEAEVAKANAEQCENRIRDMRRLRDELPEKIRKAAGVDVAERRLALATQQLNALQVQKSELTIAAHGHGIVGEYQKKPADPVIAGEPLVMVLDGERPFIEVEVPSRRVKMVQVGETLQLEFADDGFLGRIESISPQAHRRDGSNDTWIPVRIGPAGKQWPEMPIGSAVSIRLK